MRVEAFRCFVGEMWEEIADAAFSVPDLCINYREQGIVRDIGLSAGHHGAIRIENLYPPRQDVRKINLPFTDYGVDDDAEEICFFNDFRMCLRVVPSSWVKQKIAYSFEIIDVARNKSCFTTHLEPKDKSGTYPQWKTLQVSEDGRFGRFYESYFKIDLEKRAVELLASVEELPETHALQLLQQPDIPDPMGGRSIRIASDDGALTLITGLGRSLDLFGSFTKVGESLTSHHLCGDSKHKNVSFSENGRLVFVNSFEFSCVVDLISWTRIFNPGEDAIEIAHTPDGRLLATDANGEIKVWDVASGQILRRFACAGRRTPMHFSRSGELLSVRGLVCDLRTGSIPPSGALEGWALGFFGGNTSRFRILDKVAQDSEYEGPSYSMNDGPPPVNRETNAEINYLLAGSDVVVAGEDLVAFGSFCLGGVWTNSLLSEQVCPISHNQQKRPECDNPGLLRPTQSKDSGLILLPMGSGILRVMNPHDKVVRIINHEDCLAAMDVTIGQKMLERYIESPWQRDQRESRERWSSELAEASAPEIQVPKFYINAALISDDGQWVLTATHWDAVRVWNVATGLCVREFQLPPAADYFAGRVDALSLTPDGEGCYLALRDGSTHQLKTWQKDTCAWKMILRIEGPSDDHHILLRNRRFAFRQKYLMEDNEIHDLQTGAVISLAPLSRWFGDMQPFENNLLVTPDDLHLAVAHGETLVVFTLEGLQEITRLPLPAKTKTLSNMSPDGRFVVHTEAGDLLRLKLHLPGS
jgi:WD40 repeat protein